jgi:hypothetical protein
MKGCATHPESPSYPTGIDALMALSIVSRGPLKWRVFHCPSCLNFYVGEKQNVDAAEAGR